ncbi:putative UDP-N-acetylglucosamine 2-epimerase [Campylobacter iguaniorum]|uniref:Putative UDP-N-acetylglucosamine 2-epimerase n=1 Tax=Campylobacter iguaniorum TaxID=1244531 RepID=A0A076F7B5_9BACT|nr:UDP-N-acetylglucosamine 2-epimerase [Campylobacter iguaniorum]AII13916.1 putative UDP-N-acetylglucosamine 2-epimerase [Campylobacter iguaniorum]
MKKILAFTSIRSDYDLLSPLYKLLDKDEDIDFKIIVSGAHLSPNFGYSVQEIKKDGFDILLEIETLLSSDTNLSRLKSASLLLQNSLETIAKFNPDVLIYAGDREDVLIYSMIGGYLGIPTLHFFSGDHAEDGYIDNPIRHATSKLSTAHFVTLEQHKKRLIRLGEEENRIFVIGNISLDKFEDFKPINRSEIKNYFGIKNGFDNFALMIFHPITSELALVDEYFENILLNLKDRKIDTFVSYPNIDQGNTKLLKVIDKYKNDKNFIFYKNLDRIMFMSIYKQSKFIIGNSSSGVCEAASFKIPAINVGYRQVGRYADRNVIFCTTDYNDIGRSIDTATSKEFIGSLNNLLNSYGDGKSATRAFDIIKKTDFKSTIVKSIDPLKVNL